MQAWSEVASRYPLAQAGGCQVGTAVIKRRAANPPAGLVLTIYAVASTQLFFCLMFLQYLQSGFQHLQELLVVIGPCAHNAVAHFLRVVRVISLPADKLLADSPLTGIFMLIAMKRTTLIERHGAIADMRIGPVAQALAVHAAEINLLAVAFIHR